MKNKLLYSIALSAGLIGFSGCEEFLDINVDPNNPAQLPLSQILPSVEVSMTQALDLNTGLSNVTGTYMHYFVQRNTGLNDYDITGSNFGVTAPWNTLYLATLTDLQTIKEQSEATENFHYLGIAQILEAYIYSVMVDMWGDVAYFEANLGVENPTPAFDDDAAIYNDLFTKLDEGIANLGKTSVLSPGADDLIYGGNLNNWVRFANSLKLKMYNQVRLERDVSAEVSALLNSGMLIENQAQDFELAYGTTSAPDDRNPGYTGEWAPGGARYYISPYFYEIMQGRNSFFPSNPLRGIQDPRIPYYWYNQVEPTLGEAPENATAYYDANTGFVSIYMFSLNVDPNEGFDQGSSQAVAGLYPVGGLYDNDGGLTVNYQSTGNAPLRTFTHYALLYTRAELALVGESQEDHAALFEAAMRASFAKVNEVAAIVGGAPQIPQAAIDRYVSSVMTLYNGADDAGKLELIMTEKWIASYGFAVDTYTDYRRTGYPVLHDANNDVLNVTVRGREFPVSLPYPQSDINLLEGQEQRNIYLDKIFWDE